MKEIIGKNVKKYREMRGLSRGELAKLAGYSYHSPISSLEAGRQGISSEKLKIVADILEVSVDELTSDKTLLDGKEKLSDKEKLKLLNKTLQEKIRKVTEVGKEIDKVIKNLE